LAITRDPSKGGIGNRLKTKSRTFDATANPITRGSRASRGYPA
jgi:hypothetical protein